MTARCSTREPKRATDTVIGARDWVQKGRRVELIVGAGKEHGRSPNLISCEVEKRDAPEATYWLQMGKTSLQKLTCKNSRLEMSIVTHTTQYLPSADPPCRRKKWGWARIWNGGKILNGGVANILKIFEKLDIRVKRLKRKDGEAGGLAEQKLGAARQTAWLESWVFLPVPRHRNREKKAW
jgi:hypothetical protein